MTRRMQAMVAVAVSMGGILCALSRDALAQNPDPSMTTRKGWEAGATVSKYRYEEPDLLDDNGAPLSVTIKGNLFGATGAYTFTDDRRHIFTRIEGRLAYGKTDYEGSGTQTGVPDTLLEMRAVIGGDFFPGQSVTLSPYGGLGYRYLFDDSRGYTSTNAVGYRRYSNYLYAPLGLAARFDMGSKWILVPTLEYDAFLQGKQVSMLSDTGLGFNDVTNTQKHGYGYRASLMVEKEHWAFGPWMNYWSIKDSDTQPVGMGFVGQEPHNWTREYGVELRYRWY
jgi:hypothetical protein